MSKCKQFIKSQFPYGEILLFQTEANCNSHRKAAAAVDQSGEAAKECYSAFDRELLAVYSPFLFPAGGAAEVLCVYRSQTVHQLTV
jgi:hypothetical protein